MSKIGYNDVQRIWNTEIETSELQDLDDLRLNEIVEYLSSVRLSLTETPSENELQAELYTQEALNLEFMLKDLLLTRRRKILGSAIAGSKPVGLMTLAEEDFHNRVSRGCRNHDEFVDSVLAGIRSKESDSEWADEPAGNDDVEYVEVLFVQPIEEAFIGLDEVTYGPFKKNDIARIPLENAKRWIREGIVSRISTRK